MTTSDSPAPGVPSVPQVPEEPTRGGVAAQVEAVAAGRVTATDLVETTLARIAALDPQLNAFTIVTGDAARAVGGIMGSNPVPIVVGCHRVLAADGLGGFGGGLRTKEWLLAWEGSLTPTLDLGLEP